MVSGSKSTFAGCRPVRSISNYYDEQREEKVISSQEPDDIEEIALDIEVPEPKPEDIKPIHGNYPTWDFDEGFDEF